MGLDKRGHAGSALNSTREHQMNIFYASFAHQSLTRLSLLALTAPY